MIILPNATDKLQLVTSAAGKIDSVISYGETDQSTPPVVKQFGRSLVSITTATTTDVLGSPAASTTRTPEEMSFRNAHATVTNVITLLYNANGTTYEIRKVSLAPGESLDYIQGIGFFLNSSQLPTMRNQSLADQTTAAGTDTYLTGSDFTIPTNRPLVAGSRLHWRIAASKTAAGTAAWAINVRFGTAGTTADTARITFTLSGTVTAVVDNGTWEIGVIIRGPITSACVATGVCEYQHHAAVSTGLGGLSADSIQATSAAFDITTVTRIGLSINPGASGVFTMQIVKAELENV